MQHEVQRKRKRFFHAHVKYFKLASRLTRVLRVDKTFSLLSEAWESNLNARESTSSKERRPRPQHTTASLCTSLLTVIFLVIRFLLRQPVIVRLKSALYTIQWIRKPENKRTKTNEKKIFSLRSISRTVVSVRLGSDLDVVVRWLYIIPFDWNQSTCICSTTSKNMCLQDFN